MEARPRIRRNPIAESTGLALNIDEHDNALEFDLARSVAPYFRVDKTSADRVIAQSVDVVRGWEEVATDAGLPRHEREAMSPAFRLAM